LFVIIDQGEIPDSDSMSFPIIQAGESEPSMLVVSDIDDVYLPKPTDLLVNLTEARPAIESVLGRLSEMFKDSSSLGSALGPAMQTAHKLIVSLGFHVDKEEGKLTVMLRFGIGHYRRKDHHADSNFAYFG
jgi:hypothetical protein